MAEINTTYVVLAFNPLNVNSTESAKIDDYNDVPFSTIERLKMAFGIKFHSRVNVVLKASLSDKESGTVTGVLSLLVVTKILSDLSLSPKLFSALS